GSLPNRIGNPLKQSDTVDKRLRRPWHSRAAAGDDQVKGEVALELGEEPDQVGVFEIARCPAEVGKVDYLQLRFIRQPRPAPLDVRDRGACRLVFLADQD